MGEEEMVTQADLLEPAARLGKLEKRFYLPDTVAGRRRIAEKLSMRSAANVSQQLRRFDQAKTQAKLSPVMWIFLKMVWGVET